VTILIRCLALVAGAVLAAGCSMGQIAARSAASIMDGGAEAMNRESDLGIAAAAIPANIKLIEGLIAEDPDNAVLRTYAAQGLYGYAFGFVEDQDPARASRFYRRCFEHAQVALRSYGVHDILEASIEQLSDEVNALPRAAVPTLFWSASCLAKWIDLSRTDPDLLSQAGKSIRMMQQVLMVDETFNFAAPHLFFGAYYGGMSPMYGGDPDRARRHFDRARVLTRGNDLLIDVMQAQYLARQTQDRAGFHAQLQAVLSARTDSAPEMALINAIAKQKAAWLLQKEDEWF